MVIAKVGVEWSTEKRVDSHDSNRCFKTSFQPSLPAHNMMHSHLILLKLEKNTYPSLVSAHGRSVSLVGEFNFDATGLNSSSISRFPTTAKYGFTLDVAPPKSSSSLLYIIPQKYFEKLKENGFKNKSRPLVCQINTIIAL
jgi:hypothetical protein